MRSLSRGRREGEGSPLLVVAPASQHPPPAGREVARARLCTSGCAGAGLDGATPGRWCRGGRCSCSRIRRRGSREFSGAPARADPVPAHGHRPRGCARPTSRPGGLIHKDIKTPIFSLTRRAARSGPGALASVRAFRARISRPILLSTRAYCHPLACFLSKSPNR